MKGVRIAEMTNSDESSKYEETVRMMIHRENEVIHHRVTWLTTVQGLLFAALGIAWGKPEISPFVALLCILGVLMSAVSLVALVGASLAMRRLIEWWEIHKPPQYNGPDIIGLRPMKSKFFGWIGPWSFIPMLFISAWTAVWFIKR